jgi:Lon protease-like protein
MTEINTGAPLATPLALFPLKLVLFPGAVLSLKIFETRYLDLITECMRTGQAFGVVCLRQGSEAGRSSEALRAEDVGVLARIEDVEAEQPGILRVSCIAEQRFRIQAPPTQRDNGLWTAPVQHLAPDPARAPGPAVLPTVTALSEAIRKLHAHDQLPFRQPYRLDDAGWVANRWCELLPISLAAKQKLMELEDPVIRLSLVDGFLRDKKVVIG